MQVIQILPNAFLQRRTFISNNHTDYLKYRLPVLAQDEVCFTGKIKPPRIYSSNGKNAVTSLANFGVTCVCCGKKMIPASEMSRIESEKLFKGDTEAVLNSLKEFSDYMHPFEKKIFNLLQKLHKTYPQKNFAQLFETKKEDIEAKLIEKQCKIFKKMYTYAKKKLPTPNFEDLNKVFAESYEEIFNPKDRKSFSRKKFIGLTYKYTRNIAPKHQKKLMDMAEQLPSSRNQIEAFIIKYSRKNNKEIALRLVKNAVGTIEHIKPRAEGGEDSVYNYALECAADNWERSCRPMIEQIRKHPDMPQNAQKQIDQIIELINSDKIGLNKNYVTKIKGALYRESCGIIDLNISKLNTNLPDKEIY